MRWIGLVGMVGVVVLVVGPGCKQKRQTAQTGDIVVGEYASMTGSTASFGQSSHEGAVLAAEQINAAGGVLGRKLVIRLEDDRSDANEAVTAVAKLINRDNVVAILGEVASKRSLAGAGVCQKAGIPMVSPASTNPEVTKVGDCIFRVCYTDDFQGSVAGHFAMKKGWKRVAVFTDQANDYSKGLTAAFRNSFPKAGGEIVLEEKYREGDNDFKPQLTKIKAANPDAVFVPGYYSDVANILRQARQLDLKVPFLGCDGWDSPTTLELGAIADGCYFVNHYSADDARKETQAFIQGYRKRWGKTPDAMAILGYDGMNVLADAIKRAGSSDPKAIRAALAGTKDFPGASGKITIDEQRNARKPIVVLELRGGKTRKVDAIVPE